MNNIPTRQPWQLWPGAIPETTIDKIIAACEELPTERGWAQMKDGSRNATDFPPSVIRWAHDVEGLRNLLWKYAEAANQNAFFVSVMPLGGIQYTEYHGGEMGHYNAHIDVDWLNKNTPYDRKLSTTVQLSDPSEYDGGAFEFTGVQNPDADEMKKKDLCLFFHPIFHMPFRR
jgi:PKHD-type hydroxylase